MSCVFLLLSCKCSLYILGIGPLSQIRFASIFSHSVNSFYLLDGVLWTQRILILVASSLSIFSFVANARGIISRKYKAMKRIHRFSYKFFFSALLCVFRFMIHFELIFGVRLPHFACAYPVFPAPFVEKDCIFSVVWCRHSCQNSIPYKCEGLFLSLNSLPWIYTSVFMLVPWCY